MYKHVFTTIGQMLIFTILGYILGIFVTTKFYMFNAPVNVVEKVKTVQTRVNVCESPVDEEYRQALNAYGLNCETMNSDTGAKCTVIISQLESLRKERRGKINVQ